MERRLIKITQVIVIIIHLYESIYLFVKKIIQLTTNDNIMLIKKNKYFFVLKKINVNLLLNTLCSYDIYYIILYTYILSK